MTRQQAGGQESVLAALKAGGLKAKTIAILRREDCDTWQALQLLTDHELTELRLSVGQRLVLKELISGYKTSAAGTAGFQPTPIPSPLHLSEPHTSSLSRDSTSVELQQPGPRLPSRKRKRTTARRDTPKPRYRHKQQPASSQITDNFDETDDYEEELANFGEEQERSSFVHDECTQTDDEENEDDAKADKRHDPPYHPGRSFE